MKKRRGAFARGNQIICRREKFAIDKAKTNAFDKAYEQKDCDGQPQKRCEFAGDTILLSGIAMSAVTQNSRKAN